MINNEFTKQLELTDAEVLNIKRTLNTPLKSIMLKPLIKNNVTLNLSQLKIVCSSLLKYSNDPNLSEEEKQELRRLSGYVLWP